jgi:hypothetical protein
MRLPIPDAGPSPVNVMLPVGANVFTLNACTLTDVELATRKNSAFLLGIDGAPFALTPCRK